MRRVQLDRQPVAIPAAGSARRPGLRRARRLSVQIVIGLCIVASLGLLGRHLLSRQPEEVALAFLRAARERNYSAQHDLLDTRYRAVVGPADSGRLLADLDTELPRSFQLVGSGFPGHNGLVTDYRHYQVRLAFDGASPSWEGRQWFVVTLVDDGPSGWRVAFYPTYRSLLSTRLGTGSEAQLDAVLRRRLPREYRALWLPVGEVTPSLSANRRLP